jgi:hypothetical protein
MATVAIHDDLVSKDGKTKADSHRFCCPIFITDMFGTAFSQREALMPATEVDPQIRSGTLTFVSYQGAIYGITCRHVVDELEKQDAAAREKHVATHGSSVPFAPQAQRHFFFPKDDLQIHINAKFYKAPGDTFTNSFPDAAVARISPEKLAQTGKQAIAMERATIAPENWSVNAGGIAAGYPERSRRALPAVSPLQNMGVAVVVAVAPFERISDQMITMYYELENPPEADNLSGMSGGPILWTEEEAWALVGIVKKGRDMQLDPSRNADSFLTKPVIWIDGEPISKAILESWIAEIPADDQPTVDLTRRLHIPSGYRGRP